MLIAENSEEEGGAEGAVVPVFALVHVLANALDDRLSEDSKSGESYISHPSIHYRL